jgi:anti-sigma regulatory factor (Ser/Thr protein kinase)
MEPPVCELRVLLNATIEDAEDVCKQFRERLAGVQGSLLFQAELLLREALTNAVLHGSHGDRRKRVLCAVRLARGRLVISVQDEGPGFDWRSRPGQPKRPLDTCGRGIDIYRRYATRVRFNDKGNAVTLVLRLPQEV